MRKDTNYTKQYIGSYVSLPEIGRAAHEYRPWRSYCVHKREDEAKDAIDKGIKTNVFFYTKSKSPHLSKYYNLFKIEKKDVKTEIEEVVEELAKNKAAIEAAEKRIAELKRSIKQKEEELCGNNKPSLVKVRVTLKDKQRTSFIGIEKWSLTHNGETKIANHRDVAWSCTDFDSALKSFNNDEVEAVSIHYIHNNNYYEENIKY